MVCNLFDKERYRYGYTYRWVEMDGSFHKLVAPFPGCPYKKSPTIWGLHWGPCLLETSQPPYIHSYHSPKKPHLHQPNPNESRTTHGVELPYANWGLAYTSVD